MNINTVLSCAIALVASLAPAAAQDAKSGRAHAGHAVVAFQDDRAAIELTDVERAFILREMRGFLTSVQEILEASAAGDPARIATVARKAGLNGPESEHIPPSLAPKLPMAFKQLGLATHRGFDEIAAQAEKGGGADRAPKQLGALLQNCVACHAGWRLADAPKR